MGWAGCVRLLARNRPGKAPRKSQRRVRPLPPVHSSYSGRERFLCRPAGGFRRNLKNDMAGRQATQKTETEPVEIKLAHSPDSDDAFMFYALATHKLPTPGYKYTHILSDIQTLNE